MATSHWLAAAASIAVLSPACATIATAKPITRCGWIVNPTPGNWWLVDRDGEWVLGTQGGHQARGLDTLPDLTVREWVVTNGASYGYGCACMTIDAGARGRTVRTIGAFRSRPLATCRADRSLGDPG